IAGRGGSHGRWSYLRLAGMLREPLLPCGPPGSGARLGSLEPRFRRKRLACVQPGADAMAPPWVNRTTDDAGIVAARRQQKGVVGGSRQATCFVNGFPWRDMIGFRADDEHG